VRTALARRDRLTEGGLDSVVKDDIKYQKGGGAEGEEG